VCRRPLLVGVIAASMLSCFSVTPVDALAHADRALVVRGAHSGDALVTIPTAVRVNPWDALVHTSGRFAGLWLFSAGERRLVTGVMSLSFHRRRPPSTAGLTGPVELRPGAYVVTFVTDTPATIRLPMSGLRRSIRTRPVVNIPAHAAMTNTQPAPGAPSGTASIPVSLGGGDVAILASHQEGLAQEASFSDECLAPRGSLLCEMSDGPASTTVLGPAIAPASEGSYESVLVVYQSPGRHVTTRWDALFRLVGVGANETLDAFALTVDLPPQD
jgi:hypothetical protein